MSSVNFPIIVVPGQTIASPAVYRPGNGVHIFNHNICASIVGEPQVIASSSPGSRQTLSVVSNRAVYGWKRPKDNLLPQLGDTVLARVKRINQFEATVEILVVGETACTDEFQGIIRQEDIRTLEKDKAKVVSSFRPGDIVRARVISLGDQSRYYLSTADNRLGVVAAYSVLTPVDSGDILHALD